jgi:hypothetical protein
LALGQEPSVLVRMALIVRSGSGSSSSVISSHSKLPTIRSVVFGLW